MYLKRIMKNLEKNTIKMKNTFWIVSMLFIRAFINTKKMIKQTLAISVGFVIFFLIKSLAITFDVVVGGYKPIRMAYSLGGGTTTINL
jgi:hypothetical protein